MKIYKKFNKKFKEEEDKDYRFKLIGGTSRLVNEYANNFPIEMLLEDIEVFLLPWYRYGTKKLSNGDAESSEDEKQSSFSTVLSSPGGDKIFPPPDFIRNEAKKAGFTCYYEETKGYPLSVFAGDREKWEKYLLKILRTVLFSTHGMYVLSMNGYFWGAVLNCMKDIPETLEMIKERKEKSYGYGGVHTAAFMDQLLEKFKEGEAKDDGN